MMEFKQTRHQVPRGTRADAERFNVLYLFKNASRLNLTYQIRLLTFQAHTQGKKLVISLPKGSILSSDLREFIAENKKIASIERR